MSIKISDVINEIEKIASLSLQEDWDNSGRQISLGDRDVRKVLLCLEVTSNVVEEAVVEGANLIVSHHPLIFSPLKSVDSENFLGDKIISLIKNNIDVYSAHTNFDEADGGNNDYTSQLLGLQNIEKIYYNNSWQFGRTGILRDTMSLSELALTVSEKLGIPKELLRYVGDPNKKIKKVAVCTGAGSELLYMAKYLGCDAVITGDVGHHKALDSLEQGICIIDGTHFGTEINFSENLRAKLEANMGKELKMICSSVEKSPFNSLV